MRVWMVYCLCCSCERGPFTDETEEDASRFLSETAGWSLHPDGWICPRCASIRDDGTPVGTWPGMRRRGRGT